MEGKSMMDRETENGIEKREIGMTGKGKER